MFLVCVSSLAELEKEVHNIRGGLKALEAVSFKVPLLVSHQSDLRVFIT